MTLKILIFTPSLTSMTANITGSRLNIHMRFKNVCGQEDVQTLRTLEDLEYSAE